MRNILALLFACILLTACATREIYDEPIAVSSNAHGNPVSSGGSRNYDKSEQPSPRAVRSALSAASAHIDKGEYQDAERLLSKAQRLSPQEPGLYYYLAKLKYEQGRFAESEGLLKRGLSLTSSKGTYYSRMMSLKQQLENQ